MIDPQIMTTLLTTLPLILASIIWGLRLEGRVNTTQTQIADRDKFDLAQDAALQRLIETKFEAVDDRLERIERALNGSLRHGH